MSIKNRILMLLTLGSTVLVSAQIASAEFLTVTASQDLVVRRGPTIEGGLHIKQSTNNSTDRIGMIRFDASSFGANVSSASFLLTARSDSSVQFQGTYSYRVYGVPDGDAEDEVFTEGTYDPSVTGAIYDGSADLIDASQLTTLGDFTASAGTQVSLSTPELLSFIQDDTNDIVSLVVIRLTTGNNSVFEDRTHAENPPRLQLEVVPEPGSLALLGFGLFGLLGVGWRRRR